MICERQPGREELTFDEQAQLLGRQGVHYLIAEPVRDGYIELRDRKKDIIVSGGENISTIAVEQAIAEHHAVAEVAVVSTPDDKWGERPKAFVELAPGEEASEDDILAFAKEHLAGYMRPVAVEITELPKTSTGKIQKKQLRDQEWAGRDRGVG